MKCKTYKVIVLAALFALALMTEAQANVTGDCVNCHTMHNSQNGSAMATDDNGVPTNTPYNGLLKYSCLGCHTATNATTWKDPVTNAPIVYNSVAPTYNSAKGLAGGNFYYVKSVDQDLGHNVLGVTTADATLGNTPPGGSALGGQISCAGTNGCHGHNGRQSGDTAQANQITAMKGAHHGKAAPPLTGSLTDISKNYRFLLGIAGKEDADWEQETTTNHNDYKGATSFSDTTSMSFLCGECHGNFHSTSGVGSASPWVRHPTDILLPQGATEYNAYNPTTTYNNTAPVAYTDPQNPSRGTAVVMCLSCHRAHASPYYKAIRWDYKSATLATAIAGCNVCHTSKN